MNELLAQLLTKMNKAIIHYNNILSSGWQAAKSRK